MSRLVKTMTTVLAIAAVSTSAAQAAGPPTTKQLLKQAHGAFHGGAGRATDLTPVLRELARRLPHLQGAQRRDAQALLARPSDGPSDPQSNGYTVPEASGSPACSAHFCVHWVATTDDAPDLTDANGNGAPDYVDAALTAAETSHSVENDQLGWRAPKSDGTIGGDAGKVDVYLKQLGGTGIYGYAAPDPTQPNEGNNSLYAYLVIDNDFQVSEFPQYASPTTPLEVTLAHEYNHIIQFAYDFNQDTWFLESSAVWMEGKVFPAALDYLQYVRGWSQLTSVPLTTFNGTDPNDRRNVKVYGTAVWNKWLDAQYGPDVVRRAWESSLETKPPSFAVKAYDRAIRERGGAGFASQFSRFGAATAEWQAANSGFPEGSLYPDVALAGSRTIDSGGFGLKLNHTTYALVGVRPDAFDRVRLGMIAPAGTTAAVALVGRVGGVPGGQIVVALKELPKGGAGSVTLDNPSRFSRLTAVLVNADSKITGQASPTRDFIYSRDRQPYYARVTTDFTAPRVLRSSPAAGARGVARNAPVKVTFSEPVLGVSAKSLELIASNGRTVGAHVRFTAGSRVATLTPNRALGRAKRYRVRVTQTVTDTAVNALARTAVWSFGTAR
jgi:hypothetical protein